MYIEKGTNANTLYYFAEAIANRSMLDDISPDDLYEANEKLNNETIRIAKLFTRFSQAFLQVVIKKICSRYLKEKGD